jgi:hypothetical protein
MGAVGTLVVRTGSRDAAQSSWSAMRRPLAGPEIEVRVLGGREGVVLGAFQRACELDERVLAEYTLSRRASGGAAVRVGDGTVHVAVALPRLGAVIACEPRAILNRHVRPLLGAIGGAYFGRDFVSVAHRPVAYVAFGHHARAGRTLFEAFVAVRTRFDVGVRASLMGKEPATLDREPDDVARAIVAAYAKAWHLEPREEPIDDEPPVADDVALRAEPGWLASIDEAIGPIWADRARVGGELMVSSDALDHLAALVQDAGTDPDDIGEAVNEALGAPGVAIEGVRSLSSLRDVILRARGA